MNCCTPEKPSHPRDAAEAVGPPLDTRGPAQETSPDFIGEVLTSSLGVIFMVNTGITRLLSRERCHLLYRPLTDFIQENDRPAYFNHLTPIHSVKTRGSCRLHLLDRKGNPIAVRLETRLIEHQHPLRFRTSVRQVYGPGRKPQAHPLG